MYLLWEASIFIESLWKSWEEFEDNIYWLQCTIYLWPDFSVFFLLLYFFSSEDLACPGTSVDSPPSSPATRQLQYHLPVLSQEGLHRLQQGAERPRSLPRLWRLCLPQRRVLQTAGHLWMCSGKFLEAILLPSFFFLLHVIVNLIYRFN